MDEAHMSQRELSQKSGIAHETICKILNGKYPLSAYSGGYPFSISGDIRSLPS